jgi:hypothetical protein
MYETRRQPLIARASFLDTALLLGPVAHRLLHRFHLGRG